MFAINKSIVSKAIDSLIAMSRLHISHEYAIYRFVEINNNQRLYGFGQKSVYAYAGALNLQYVFPNAEILSMPGEVITQLKGLQDKNTSFYYEDTHHILHATASAVACLLRWDNVVWYDCSSMIRKLDIVHELNFVRWAIEPWRDSNIPSALSLLAQCFYSGLEKTKFNDSFVSWLNENACSQTGLWKKGYINNEKNRGVFPAIAGAFHLLYHLEFINIEYEKKELLRSTCLTYYKNQAVKLFNGLGYVDIDFLYCLLRSYPKNISTGKDASMLCQMFYDFCVSIIRSKAYCYSTDIHKIFGSSLVFYEFYRMDFFKELFNIEIRSALDAAPFA